MQIHHIQLKNFRCFENFSLAVEKPIIVITGDNGSGKSSLLEAIHYGCYLRSFRTHVPSELVHFGDTSFFMKFEVESVSIRNTLQIGFAGKKRLVKIDQKTITSYKELAQLYRIVTLTEDDLFIIKGGPEIRRFFIDQALSLQRPEFVAIMKQYRSILEQRNAFLQKNTRGNDLYEVLTQQLWNHARLIQEHRIFLLQELQEKTNALLLEWFDDSVTLQLIYQPKRVLRDTFTEFMHTQSTLFNDESRYGRTLFGAHLDDIVIQFCQKTSRSFASRGQQKLIVMLLKIAQMQMVLQNSGSGVFLLDDFMTDFDAEKSRIVLTILQHLKTQLFLTAPTVTGFFEGLLQASNIQHIKLTT